MSEYQAEHNHIDQQSPIFSEFADDPAWHALIVFFESEVNRQMIDMQNALANDDLSRVGHISHQLLGASGGYGFPTIGEAARDVERATQEAMIDSTNLETLFKSVKHLAAQCQRIASVESTAPSTEHLQS